MKRRLPIATRSNGRPAYENAPARRRQSDIERPHVPYVEEQGFIAKLFGSRHG
jgi:hypothetical protein